MAEKKPKKTREQILDEAKARTDAKLAAREARAAAQRATAAADRQLRLQAGNEQFSRDAINRQRLQATAPRNTRTAQARPLPQVRGTPPTNPADMTAAQRFAANPAGGIQGRVRGAPAPLPPQAPPGVLDRLSTARPLSRAGRALSRVGGAAAGPAGLMLEPEIAEAPLAYPAEEQQTFGMPQEEFMAQLIEAGIADPQQIIARMLQPQEVGRMDAMQAPDPFANEFLNYPSEPRTYSPLPSDGTEAPDPFDNEFLNFDMAAQEPVPPEEGMSAYKFGRDYLNPALTAVPDAYSYLQDTLGRGTANLLRGAFGYEQLPEEQELIERGAPHLTDQQFDQQVADFRAGQNVAPEQAPQITRTPADPFEQQRIALIEEYMAGQQQADPRQRQIMGSANEFATNRPEPRMSQQQLEAALMQLAREESMQATDPFAGYDESLFPEQFVEEGRPRGVTVDPITGATRFEGGQRYPRDAELPGRQSMDDLRLGTEYTSRALRNVGRARGVPSPQEVERSRMLSTLGGDAQGQGYRADQLAEQMRRTRSGLNAANLTPLELEAGQTQLESQGAELAAARGGAEQARALQLQGSMQPPFPAPEDFDLQQLQEAATAQAQADAVAEQRRALEELRIGGRNQVDARDMQQYTEMFSSMEPSAVPEGMSLASADPEIQEAERARVNRIQLATTLASSQEGFRTQPALAMEAARLLSTLRDNPRRQTAYMNVLLEADPSELAQALQILYEKLGAT